MKYSKPLRALTLITLALFMGVAQRAACDEHSSKPATSASSAAPTADQIPRGSAHTVTVDKPYSYYGTFNYNVAPAPAPAPAKLTNPIEERWRIAGEIAAACSALMLAILAGLLWSVGRSQKRMAEATEAIARLGAEATTLVTGIFAGFSSQHQELVEEAATLARQSVELTTLVGLIARLLRDFSPQQKETAEAAATIARQSIELTNFTAGFVQNLARRGIEMAAAAEMMAIQGLELKHLVAGRLGDVARHQKEMAEAAQATARQSVELTTLAAGRLEDFGRHQREMAEAAQATAQQSLELTNLALNAERPHMFIEEQDIEMSLPLPTTLATRTMAENIALEPLRYAADGVDAANVTLRFMLHNRGKGIAVVRRIRTRMLIGRGALTNTDLKLAAIGTADGNVRANVIGGGEKAEGFCFGLGIPLETLDEVRQFNLSLRFVVVVSHVDVFGRPFVTSSAFEYRPPIRSAVFAGSPDYPSMLLPVLRDGRLRGRGTRPEQLRYGLAT